MAVSDLASRLRRPLAGVIAVVLSLGSLSAVRYEPASRAVEVTRSTDRTAVSTGRSGDDDAHVATSVPAAPTGGAADGGPSRALGPSAVPVPGRYRYQVTVTKGTETSVEEEQRVIEVLSGDDAGAVVQISAQLAGETQVSVLDWSSSGAFVRSTRIEDASGPSQDCTWSPAFPDLGLLTTGSSWTLDSTCRTPVGGIDTTFRVTGTGGVVGPATVDTADGPQPVWQLERDRTTSIQATFGDRTVTQQAREQGTIWFDPRRGIVVRSDVTVTLTGTQSGVTRRVSVLQPA